MARNQPKILLAEDEPVLRLVTQKQLNALGYQLTDTAENGLVAVQKALAADFDIIFMDVRMPDLDGITATRHIRAAGRDSIIIGMTAFSHKDQCLEAGMDDFLQKPVMLQQLKDALQKWINGRPSATKILPKNSLPDLDAFEQTAERLAELRAKIEDLRRRSLPTDEL